MSEIHIIITDEHGDDIAERFWPDVPRVGERIFVSERDKTYTIFDVAWGSNREDVQRMAVVALHVRESFR